MSDVCNPLITVDMIKGLPENTKICNLWSQLPLSTSNGEGYEGITIGDAFGFFDFDEAMLFVEAAVLYNIGHVEFRRALVRVFLPSMQKAFVIERGNAIMRLVNYMLQRWANGSDNPDLTLLHDILRDGINIVLPQLNDTTLLTTFQPPQTLQQFEQALDHKRFNETRIVNMIYLYMAFGHLIDGATIGDDRWHAMDPFNNVLKTLKKIGPFKDALERDFIATFTPVLSNS